MRNKHVYIIAGSNGSGKTTFAKTFLPRYAECPQFVNADLIAMGLSPFDPQKAALKAGKLVLQQIIEYSKLGMDFGFETTLSGKSYVRVLQKLHDKGYQLHLFFLWIPTTSLAIARISGRVLEGGHNVPSEDVRRRFSRCIINFFALYKPLMDTWMIFDNSGTKPELMAQQTGGKTEILNKELYAVMEKMR